MSNKYFVSYTYLDWVAGRVQRLYGNHYFHGELNNGEGITNCKNEIEQLLNIKYPIIIFFSKLEA